jgi:hypothetical protein
LDSSEQGSDCLKGFMETNSVYCLVAEWSDWRQGTLHWWSWWSSEGEGGMDQVRGDKDGGETIMPDIDFF